MKRPYLNTAFAVMMSATFAHAQPDDDGTMPANTVETPQTSPEASPVITPPDGYVEGEVVLTTDNMDGASVYDASGDEIGTVHGLVFDSGDTFFSQTDADDAAMQPPDVSRDSVPITDSMPTANDGAGMATTSMSGNISHAVIDVGGFLGMGAHRVAVLIGDLKVYRRDTDLRIYLPWTKQQIEALPEFDEDGPVPSVQ